MAPRYTLSTGDVVLRGCREETPEKLLESMRAHYAFPETPNEWGLSVASMPGAGESAIVKAARQLRQTHYRVAHVEHIYFLLGDPNRPGYEWQADNFLSAVWDHNAHALIVALREPTLDLAARIASAFGPPQVNPFYEERKRSRAGR